jgi:hypothetical protein
MPRSAPARPCFGAATGRRCHQARPSGMR